MARTVDILVVFVSAHGTRAIASGASVPVQRLRRMFPTDRAFADGLRFWHGNDRLSGVDAWLAAERPERLYVMDATRLVPAQPVTVGTVAVPPRMLHGFAGAPRLLMVARRRGGGYSLHHFAESFSPRTFLKNSDVVAFVEGRPERDVLVEKWLWWHEHNLKWTADAGWEGFARAASAQPAARLADDSSIVYSNVAVPEAVRRAWQEYANARRNPDFGPVYDVREVDTRDEVALFVDRDDARSRLATALQDIVRFAADEQMDGWAGSFAGARAALDAPAPQDWLARDLGGAGLDAGAMQLLDAAWRADAFGGMGSWNDVGAKDTARYQRVSQALFEALRPAVEAAVNQPSREDTCRGE